VMQLEAKPSQSLKHNADLREVVSDVQRFGDRLDVPLSNKQVTHEIRRIWSNNRSRCKKKIVLTPKIKGDLCYPLVTPAYNRMERRLARKISVKYSVTFAPSIK